MWKALGKVVTPIIKEAIILSPESVLQQQLRTTFILKRKTAPYLNKNGSHTKRLRNRHFIYELVKDTTAEKLPKLEVILNTYVPGLGNIGERVLVKQNYAYDQLLMPGLAVYASPENIEKYKHYENKKTELVYSSATSQRVVNCLGRMTLLVTMNRENTWTLEKWHIKASFRKFGYHVPEETITLPDKLISGPNLDIENKDFYVTVTVNNTEQVKVRCKIHHWSTDVLERLPYEPEFWKVPIDPIFSEDAAILASLPSCPDVIKQE